MGATESTQNKQTESSEDIQEGIKKVMTLVSAIGERCGSKDVTEKLKNVINEQSDSIGERLKEAMLTFAKQPEESEKKPTILEAIKEISPEIGGKCEETVKSFQEIGKIVDEISIANTKHNEQAWLQLFRTIMIVIAELDLDPNDVPKIKEELRKYYHLPDSVLGSVVNTCYNSLYHYTVRELQKFQKFDSNPLFKDARLRDVANYFLFLLITETPGSVAVVSTSETSSSVAQEQTSSP